MGSYPLAEMTRARNLIAELETKLRNETIERETFQHGMRQQERRIEQLEREKAELVKALRDVIGWVPGHKAWHTDEPIKSVERARALLGATATEGGEG